VRTPGGLPETAWSPTMVREEPAFLAYSVTKTVIATVVVLLHEEGRLDLDDALARWFPKIDRAERIPLRRLLDHTAGVRDYGALPAYHDAVRAAPGTPWTFARFAAETIDLGLAFEPGQGWAYSNPGYMLVKRVVEEVAGSSLADLVRDRIARPLGLDRTRVVECIEDLTSLAPASSRALAEDGEGRSVQGTYHPDWVSHGVIASTPSQIVRFVDALFGGSLVRRASLEAMQALVSVPLPPAREGGPPPRWREPGYGLGLMGDPGARWGPIWGHGGGGPGYAASVFHAPALGGVSACAMAASDEGFDAEEVVFALLDAHRAAGRSVDRSGAESR
jgi:D-alanyl-D-alanine carboxypeptidase